MTRPKPCLYSVSAAATMLGIGRTTAWKFVNDATLESVIIGRRRMVRAESLHRLIEFGMSERPA